jgi:hypothetical protein
MGKNEKDGKDEKDDKVMSHFKSATPPTRESRLNPSITFGGTICGLAGRRGKGCLESGERSFSQGAICLLLPALAIINSLPGTAVLIHGASGCGACTHSQNANVRAGCVGNVAWSQQGGSALQVGGPCGCLGIPGTNPTWRALLRPSSSEVRWTGNWLNRYGRGTSP